MKKTLLTLLLACLGWSGAQAVPAYPGKIRFTQPDGTTLWIQQKGDEFAHQAYTEDGYPLLMDTKSGCYMYAKSVNGKLLSSGIKAVDIQQRGQQAKSFLQTVDKSAATSLQRSAIQRPSAKKAPRLRISDIPTTGHRKVLVVLVRFSDKNFSSYVGDPKTFYEGLLNGRNYSNQYGATGSAYDFYHDSSNGVYDPEFTVVGPVKVSKKATYYGGSSGDGTRYVPDMMVEVANLIKDSVNLADFDTNNDGVVDNLYVFYAGLGQADAGGSWIWPHSYELSAEGKAVTINGVTIDRYACSQELNGGSRKPVGIGTFVHEFGHVLGIPDLYDTSYSSAYTLEDWDTMCAGSYNNDQCTPPLFSAYEKYALDWAQPITLLPKDTTEKQLVCLTDSAMFYRVSVPGNSKEYFLLENRQQKSWDTYLPGHGMLVWHIDEQQSAWNANKPNNNYDNPVGHKCVDIVEADNRESYSNMDADPFPGTKNVKTKDFDDWNGNKLFGLANVTEQNDIIRFKLNGEGFSVTAPDTLWVDNVMGLSAVAHWSKVSDADDYELLLKQGTDTILHEEFTTESAVLSNLQPETTYQLSVIALKSGYASDTLKTTFTTLAAQLRELTIHAKAADDVTENSFVAQWDGLDGVENYLLTIYAEDFGGETLTQSYDFSQKSSGLPAGWSTNSIFYINNNYSHKGYALRLRPEAGQTEEPYLNVSHPEGKVTGVNFWSRSTQSGNTLTVEAYKGDSIAKVDTLQLSTSALISNYQFDKADSVRLVFHQNVSGSYVGIDDVTLSYVAIAPVAIDSLTDVNVGQQTSYLVDGLLSDTNYYYTVIGTTDTDTTQVSNRVFVKTLSPVNVIETLEDLSNATGASREVYDLQGRRISGAQLPHGIYIVKEGKRSRKVVVK